jgi:hypothetical protein
MHILHLIRLTHMCMYVFTFYIVAIIIGLIMTILMTLFINIELWILPYFNLMHVLCNIFTLMICWQFLYPKVSSD